MARVIHVQHGTLQEKVPGADDSSPVAHVCLDTSNHCEIAVSISSHGEETRIAFITSWQRSPSEAEVEALQDWIESISGLNRRMSVPPTRGTHQQSIAMAEHFLSAKKPS